MLAYLDTNYDNAVPDVPIRGFYVVLKVKLRITSYLNYEYYHAIFL